MSIVLLPRAPIEGPPLPTGLGPYLPFKGYWPWYKSLPAEDSGVGITLYDQYGNIIVASSSFNKLARLAYPAQATEGDTITASVTATNASYKNVAGVKTPIPMTPTLKISGTGVLASLNSSINSITLPAGAMSGNIVIGSNTVITVSQWPALSIKLPTNLSGAASVIVTMVSPSGTDLATTNATINVVSATPIWSGVISIT